MAGRQNSSGEHIDKFLKSRLDQIKLMPRYTTIIHQVRSRLGLSNNEYCVFDSIDKLSNKPNHPFCTRSKDELAAWLEIGRRTVFRAIDVGLEKGLIEKNVGRSTAQERCLLNGGDARINATASGDREVIARDPDGVETDTHLGVIGEVRATA